MEGLTLPDTASSLATANCLQSNNLFSHRMQCSVRAEHGCSWHTAELAMKDLFTGSEIQVNDWEITN